MIICKMEIIPFEKEIFVNKNMQLTKDRNIKIKLILEDTNKISSAS